MTKSLIAVIEGVGAPSEINLNTIIESSAKNKILLHILRALSVKGSLRKQQEARRKRTLRVVQTLSNLLKDHHYAFFKLTKPIAYVPADIDILIDISQASEAAREIIRLGYNVAAKDPYCITLTKADSIIDLYTHPSLGGAIFLNGQKLLEHKTQKEFNRIEIRTLEEYAEALVATTHAIYKERIYTLNDYYTIEKWTTKKTYKLAQELKCESAIKIAIDLNRKIRQGILETPYKIPIPKWITVLMQKFKNDSLMRSTSTSMLKTLINKRAGKLLMSKLTRKTY